LQGVEYVLEGGGRGPCPGCSGGRGRPTLLVLWLPASEKRGIGYRWYACTTSMIRVEDPGTSFMLYLGPGPPSLLHLTRANETEPYPGDTMGFSLNTNNFAVYLRTFTQCVFICMSVIQQTVKL
jgi:hypothetical protein